ncbi:exonuclease SbcCD subunit D [Clostridium malenominatum]|uniref:Exonuclease SbcCD subunit D n=1 Tax=Clostridium malenominatum TaxID=1539 RepID=A0ABN1IUR4_9CLOT
MSSDFTFIHSADIHLGKVMSISGEVNDNYNNEIFESFKYMCTYAKENKVDFILISGDLFHSRGRDIRVDKFFYEQCENIHPIKIYVIFGNHDPMKEYKEIFKRPSNVIILSSEEPQVEDIYKEGNFICRVIGQSYYSNYEKRKIHKNYDKYLNENKIFTIGMLHTGLAQDNYLPCALTELKDISKINYWALGHIHKNQILNMREPFIAYPGNIQGSDFGEEGVGGFYSVKVKNNKIDDIEFIHASKIIWEKITVNIDEKNNVETLEELIGLITLAGEEFLEKYNISNIENKTFIIRWVVEGRGEIHNLLKEKEDSILTFMKEELNYRIFKKGIPIWTEEVVIRTKPILNYGDLENNYFYKEVKEIVRLSLTNDELKNEVLKSLGQVWSYGYDELSKDYEFNLSEEDYCELIRDAMNLIEEKILEGGD